MPEQEYKPHWSFKACSKQTCFFVTFLLIFSASIISYITQDGTHMNRFGAFITGVGVWISMRGTFREGLSRCYNYNDDKPVINGNQYNIQHFNIRNFRRGDAELQVYGFIIVFIGSTLSAYGDKIYQLITL